MARGVGLLVSTIVIGAMALLAGCAARQPWERDWPRPGSSALREEPYLWCGLEPAEMARRLVGAFPLGSSRLEVRATIERLGLASLIEDPAALSHDRIHLTAGGVVYPVAPTNDDHLVLHVGNWAEYEPGVINRFVLCPYFVRFDFDSEVLRAVELRQHRVAQRDVADPAAYWRDAARKGIVVFTYGIPED